MSLADLKDSCQFPFILLFDGDSLIAKTQMKQMSAIEIPVIFSKPIPLNRDIIYTLVAHMSGGQTYYSVGGVSSANRQMSGQRNLKITFHDPEEQTTTGTNTRTYFARVALK